MRLLTRAIVNLILIALVATAASAQATRTWVSGVGDDANPCSRTAPCKTFGGAISKTATGGEINVLDPGGFGAVTITKSITISSWSFEAGVLVSGTNGIIVNAPSNAVVILRGLDIEGLGTGLAGIKVLAAGAVYVENCTINNFTQLGIDFAPSTTTPGSVSQLHVTNSIIRNNLGANSGGIRVRPGANVTAEATIENTLLHNNLFGVRADDRSNVEVKSSSATSNTNAGFLSSSASAAVVMTLENCVSAHNAFGLKADNAGGTIRAGNCSIIGNTTAVGGTGHRVSFGHNNTDGPAGSFPEAISQQ